MDRNIFEEEHEMFRDAARSFLINEIQPHVDKWTEQEIVDREAFLKAGEQGLLCMWADEKYGGAGVSDFRYEQILLEENARYGDVGFFMFLHSRLVGPYIGELGTEEQKARWLPKCVSGESILAVAMTEASAGSDISAIRTKAEDKGDHYLLNGSKTFISNGILADLVIVAAKTEPNSRHGLSLFVVERGMEGFERGQNFKKMGMHSQDTAEMFFDNVKVPKENLLGPLNGGFKVAMNILNNGRSGLAGGCVGGMKTLIALTARHATERHQFDQPVGSFGLIKQKIGHMVVDCYATESAVNVIAALADRGYEDFSIESAITKVFGTEALWRSADEALQTAGGTGFMREYPYERVVRDCRINRIYEGTNEILRLFIALSALNDVGQRLKELAGSLRGIFDDPIKGFGILYEYAKRRATWATGLPVSNPRMSKAHVALRAESEIFEDTARDLAAMTDRLLRKHGKGIIGKQFATRRLADVMIDLFVLACVLSRVTASIEAHGQDAAEQEIEIAKVFAGQVLGRAKRNFRKIDANDDELVKHLAESTYERGGYGWDVL
jgi:acyl-CoA dehydrogenase family protein 9